MNQSRRMVPRILLILSIALVSFSITQSAHADAPAIIVTATWHPGTQLTTIDMPIIGQTDQPHDDLRYVDLELDATTNVQFWATELTCTVNPAVLQTYVPNSDPGVPAGTGANVPVVTWGNKMLAGGPGAQIQQPFNSTTGAMTIAAANGLEFPAGLNMQTTSFSIATIRYRVKSLTAAATSTLSCSGSFLNADGKPVLAPTFVMPPALNVIPGYILSGNISYQGRAAKNGIAISCFNPASPSNWGATTDVNGNFSIPTRVQGTFTCNFYGNSVAHPVFGTDLYLQSKTQIPMNILSYKLLPVTLYGGNLDRSNTVVNATDLALVTANYNLTTSVGDVNGDGKTDRSDLAIVAGNLTLNEVVDVSHMLFGFTDGLVTNGSRIWRAQDAVYGSFSRVTQQIPGTNADNWPALSPDGSKLVVTRRLGSGPNYRYALFVMNSDGSGTATQLTPITGANGIYDAFAPSWSPDGSEIAFDCATVPANANDSWMVDNSNLCVVDPAGHDFRVLDYHVSIFPPAWLDTGHLLVAKYFGGTTSSIVEVPLTFGGDSTYNVQDSTSYIDDPIVSNGALFYRYMNPNIGFRMAELDNSGNVQTAYPSATPPYHVDINQFGTYMSVRSGGRDIVYGGSDGMTFETVKYNNDGTWSGGSNWIFRDAIGNPAWNGTPGSSSYIYALTNTMQWLP